MKLSPPLQWHLLGRCLLFVLCGSCSSMRSGLQSAYNSDPVGRIANELTGTKWVNCAGPPPPVRYAGRHTVLIFFSPASQGTASCVDDIAKLYEEFSPKGVVFFGVTDSDAERLSFFLDDHPLPIPILTEASADRMQFGIKKLFEPEVLLVDPYSRVLGDGIRECRKLLRERLPS